MSTVPPRVASSRPRVLLVTASEFWRPISGDHARTAALVGALARHCELSVMFAGAMDDAARREARAGQPPFRIVAGNQGRPSREGVLRAFRQVCGALAPQAVILSRLRLDFLRVAVPAGVPCVLDTHDLESDSAPATGAAPPPDFDAELALLARYDKVLLIQRDDHARVVARLGARAMCVPHPVRLEPAPVRPGSRTIGYCASRWVSNVRALQWLLDEIWPALRARGATLQVAGFVTRSLPAPPPDGVVSRGYVPGLQALWSGFDVAVNPVRDGSGLKIKNVEALAAGIPLVTTTDGARGLRDAVGDAILVADDAPEFARACLRLLDDDALRARMAAGAHAYARANFSPEACFGGLLGWLASLAEPARPGAPARH